MIAIIEAIPLVINMAFLRCIQGPGLSAILEQTAPIDRVNPTSIKPSLKKRREGSRTPMVIFMPSEKYCVYRKFLKLSKGFSIIIANNFF